MLRNFFKITLRNFRKNKSYVCINLIGLGLSLACCIVAYLNWKYSAEYDQNHENHTRIFKIHSYKQVQGEKMPYGITPIGLGEHIKDRLPELTHTTRYEVLRSVLKKDEKVLEQTVAFAEDDYFEMFTLPLKYGSKEAFLDRSHIILSESTSTAYFGNIDPTGMTITLIDFNNKEYPMIVGGVLERIPTNSSMLFQAITHYDNYLKIRGFDRDTWANFNAATFVMTDGTYPQNLLPYINKNCIAVQNKARENWQIAAYYLEPLTTLAKNADGIRSNWLNFHPPMSAIRGPAIMAVMLLLIACFNFTNTSIAISSKRLKEIGIRKVMGSQRRQLIVQFMGENLILCFGALLLGLALADMLVPAYSAIWEFIDIRLDLWADVEIYVFLTGLLFVTALIAGAYPSLYISWFQPVKILRGGQSLGSSSKLSRLLLGMQYLLTAMSLVSAYAFYHNSIYQANYDLGFSKDEMLSVGFDNNSEYEAYRPIVEQMPEVDAIAATYNRIGEWSYSRTLRNGEREIESDIMEFTTEYFDMMDLEVSQGRFFDDNLHDHDRKRSVVVNEQLVADFGWKSPIGQVVHIDDSTRLTVIGVMNNFYDEGFFDGIEPMAIRLADPDKMNYLLVKSKMNPVQLYDRLQASWQKVIPNRPFDGVYDNEVKNATDVNQKIMWMFQFIGLVSLILSVIGLYTLVSLSMLKRTKEIGIRMVLGATIRHIVYRMNAQFFWLLLLFSSLGAIISYFTIDLLMSSIFEVYQAATFLVILIPLLLLVFIAVFTASARILKTAIQNPVESLRYE